MAAHSTQVDSAVALTFAEYAERAGATARYPGRGEGNLTYPTLGLTGEAGEVAEKVKKILRDQGGEIGDKRELLVKELGDVLWYVAALAHELGVSLDSVALGNLEKLESRRARGVLGGSGDER